jgi:hypothetical protein
LDPVSRIDEVPGSPASQTGISSQRKTRPVASIFPSRSPGRTLTDMPKSGGEAGILHLDLRSLAAIAQRISANSNRPTIKVIAKTERKRAIISHLLQLAREV